jgi:hypothetical protein
MVNFFLNFIVLILIGIVSILQVVVKEDQGKCELDEIILKRWRRTYVFVGIKRDTLYKRNLNAKKNHNLPDGYQGQEYKELLLFEKNGTGELVKNFERAYRNEYKLNLLPNIVPYYNFYWKKVRENPYPIIVMDSALVLNINNPYLQSHFIYCSDEMLVRVHYNGEFLDVFINDQYSDANIKFDKDPYFIIPILEAYFKSEGLNTVIIEDL